jgi:transposase
VTHQKLSETSRECAMWREAIAETGERVGAVTRVARQLGIGPESLRNWVKQAEIARVHRASFGV